MLRMPAVTSLKTFDTQHALSRDDAQVFGDAPALDAGRGGHDHRFLLPHYLTGSAALSRGAQDDRVRSSRAVRTPPTNTSRSGQPSRSATACRGPFALEEVLDGF